MNRSKLGSIALMLALSAGTFAQDQAAPASPARTQAPAAAQQPKPKPQKTVRRPPTRQTRVTMVKDQEPVAPQVVTIVHRLSGVKLLRYLLRESDGRTVATMDPEDVTSDAHASIIAGWALEDGKTIAARLPRAAAEMEIQRFGLLGTYKTDKPDRPGKSDESDESADMVQRRLPRAARMQPDLTVMTQDGRIYRARYVGIDGLTGLSVLQLGEPLTPAISEVAAKKTSVGQNVKLFAPERVSAEATPYTIFVRIGKTDARIVKAFNAKAQWVERLSLRADKLSPNVIGGVACDESGKTLGIVDSIEGSNAQLLTADSIRAAARRVLDWQSSVPRPLLGIRGEAVDKSARKALLDFGWNEEQFEKLIEKQVGILLTQILPGTPAALAKLHPGDIIIRVDDKEVKGAEEFSAMLTKAGSGEEVRFTVQSPKTDGPVKLDVRLGGAYQPLFEWQYEMPVIPRRGGLKTFGVEAVELSSKSAEKWGGAGLLVVAIEADSAAARAGLREGDVIESIDGRSIGRGAWTFVFTRKDKYVFSVVRAREKKQIVVGPVD
ncbi:MAG: PDZ domain-containing protein [Pyrinomonadaceae bacterium]